MYKEEEFTTRQQALAIKELGFNEPCIAWSTLEYENVMLGNKFKIWEGWELPTKPFGVPLRQQVFKWFREKHGLFCQPNRTVDPNGTWYYFSIATKRHDVVEGSFSYEDAESACIDKLIELVKTFKIKTC